MLCILLELLIIYSSIQSKRPQMNDEIECPAQPIYDLYIVQNGNGFSQSSSKKGVDLYSCNTKLTHIHGYKCLVHLYHCNFTNITEKTKEGGAIYVYTQGKECPNTTNLTVHFCNFQYCTGSDGGAICFDTKQDSRYIEIFNCSFIGNKAVGTNGRGGAIRFSATYGFIEDCTFIDNNGKQGGDIYYNCSSSTPRNINKHEFLTIKNNIFIRNTKETSTNSIVYLDWKKYSNLSFTNNQVFIDNSITSSSLHVFAYKGTLYKVNLSILNNCISPYDTSYVINHKTLGDHFKNGFTGKCSTPTPALPKPSLTATPEPSLTATPEPSLTATPEPSLTATPEPSLTATPEPSLTATPEKSLTATPEPSLTATPEPSLTATPEPSLTATPEPSLTATPEPSLTATPEPSLTATPEPSLTATPEPSLTATPEPSLTATLEPSLTATREKSSTATPEQSISEIPKQPVAATSQPSLITEQYLTETPLKNAFEDSQTQTNSIKEKEQSATSNTYAGNGINIEGFQNSKNRKISIWAIIGIVLAVIVVMLIIIFLIIAKKRQKDDDTQDKKSQEITNDGNESMNISNNSNASFECINALYNSADHQNKCIDFDSTDCSDVFV